MTPRRISVLFFLVLCAANFSGASPAGEPARDFYKDVYVDYQPDFVARIEKGGGVFKTWKRTPEEMKLSAEPSFFTLTVIHEDSRANALIEAGLKKEREGQHREALKIYQQVMDKHAKALYRVSSFGIFVPVTQYCQRRILTFPTADLAFYRTLHDPVAKEAFEQARRQFSLLGLSDVAESMLATSYGGPALLELGNAALEAGHYLAALERFSTVNDLIPDAALKTPELAWKINLCRKMVGETPGNDASAKSRSNLSPDQLQRLKQLAQSAAPPPVPFFTQKASGPHVSADDYTLHPPIRDLLATQGSVWQTPLPGSRHDFFLYSQPTVTQDSVLYRHKNIVYCRSLLNGELRWHNDLGGRANWQDWQERQYPQEDLLVQDGLVFTAIKKGGPSLVALDEVTGQLRWAYGPMVATTEEEARMRFEAAPAGGPGAIYAGYVLDNIEGETHTDTEYGVMAFDQTSGRVHWRTPLCRLAPGKFAGGAEERRNRLRSFTSPPLYHEGTVYYTTNAGAVAALDALSGQVKWLTRYPYYPGVHEATRTFGRGGEPVQYTRVLFRPHTPMFWYNQRPLLSGERLVVLPVDSNMMLCLDRGTGRVSWTSVRAGQSSAYLLGLSRQGQLVVAYTGRNRQIRAEATPGPIHLLDVATGKTLWESPDLVMKDDSPLMSNYAFGSPALHFQMNESWFEMAARPFLTQDGKVHVTSFRYLGYPIYGWVTNLGILDLEKRQVAAQRRYYSGEVLARADKDIHENGPAELKAFEAAPEKGDANKQRIQMLKEVVGSEVPQNEYGPFLPFSRLTFERFGVQFEMRLSARQLEMVYDRRAVRAALAAQKDPRADFARAELAIADSRREEAAELLQKCMARIAPEDLDFRAAINQQLYGVYQELARQAIRAGRSEDELEHCLGLSRTAGTVAQEIEALFAIADAYQRRDNLNAAGKVLRLIIATYGHHDCPIAPLALAESKEVLAATQSVFARYETLAKPSLHGPELMSSLELMKKGLPLYLSTLSPLPKTLTVRTGDLAAQRLLQLQQRAPQFAQSFQATARQELTGKTGEELERLLPEFPGTQAAQETLDQLLTNARKGQQPGSHPQTRQLIEVARVGGLTIPSSFRTKSGPAPEAPAILLPQITRNHEFADQEGLERLVLERRDDLRTAPEILFVGARVRKRLDNKFLVTAFDLGTGKQLWQTEELRLKGKGQEPGFFKAFVHADRVVVHGLYDVLAFDLREGRLCWRYQVPFDFEIRQALLSGDLLLVAGATETLALSIPTSLAAGEVAWQVKEMGDFYGDSYLGDGRLISVRKMPFAVTVRSPATGRLIGRLDLPDLSLQTTHPLLENGPAALPMAHADELLVLTDGWYYLLIDTNRVALRWKRPIDSNDVTRDPALRFALSKDYLAVLKEDFDKKALYLLSSSTGEVLWKTDARDARSPQPLHSLLFAGDKLYGIQPHAGQGFYVVGRECRTGQELFRQEVTGFQGKPEVTLRSSVFGPHLVVESSDHQTFQLRVFDATKGTPLHTLEQKGVGPLGVHGRVSLTVQHGRLVLLTKESLSY
jgi:outer membrane protein assembly factor BamB/tetratricopeptide (TPR) repeat protein